VRDVPDIGISETFDCLLYITSGDIVASFTEVIMNIDARYNGPRLGLHRYVKDANRSDIVTTESINTTRLTEVSFSKSLRRVNLQTEGLERTDSSSSTVIGDNQIIPKDPDLT